VTTFRGVAAAPQGMAVYNPRLTSRRTLISAIVTEKGILTKTGRAAIARLKLLVAL
jgi:methylthioribose-1-phosphate isomerase